MRPAVPQLETHFRVTKTERIGEEYIAQTIDKKQATWDTYQPQDRQEDNIKVYLETRQEIKDCLPLPQKRNRIQDYPSDVRLRKIGSALLSYGKL